MKRNLPCRNGTASDAPLPLVPKVPLGNALAHEAPALPTRPERTLGTRLLLFPFLLTLGCLIAPAEDNVNLVSNPGFESGAQDWSLFVPDEYVEKNCQFTVVNDNPHSGTSCAKLTAGDFARFAVGHRPVTLIPGDHYRVSAWFRADAQASFAPRSPGLAIRMTFNGGHHIQINAEGEISPGNPTSAKNPIPTVWTQVSVVMQAPNGVTSSSLEPFSFAKGALYLDDISVQKVDSTVALTPLEGGTEWASLAASASSTTGAPPPPVLPAQPGPLTTDAEMIAELNLAAPGMDKVKAAVQSGQLPAIHAAYLDYRQHISTAKWTNMPGDTQTKVTDQTIATADQIAHNSVWRGAYHYGPPITLHGR